MSPKSRMSNILKSLLILFIIACFQAIIYFSFLRPVILTWGATEDEIKAQLVGDSLAPWTSSTHAIKINAPNSDVWKWLVQLGSDRGGFYSYTFLERLLGYESIGSDAIVPEFQEMKVGRIVRASLPQSKTKSSIKGEEATDSGPSPVSARWMTLNSWPVVAVDPGNSFVLENWGAFVLRPIDSEHTRLIVRTHGREIKGSLNWVNYYIFEPLHYIMERKMLIGIKDRAEAGSGIHLSSIPDLLWFIGIVLSGVAIILITFISRGIQKVLLPAIFSFLWLLSLLIFSPQPIYSIMLFLMLSVTTIWCLLKKDHPQKA